VKFGFWFGALWLTSCYQRLEFDVPSGSAGSAGSAGSSGGSAGSSSAAGTTSGGARGCVADVDCPLPSLRCDVQSGQCFECVANVDCTARGLGRCDGALHRCVECGIDADCADGFACDLTTRACAQRCDEDDSCPVATHGCDETRLSCVECEPDDDDGCALYPDRPFCLLPGNRCAECLVDGDCAEGLVCDTLTGKCLGCRDSRDCGAGQACEPAGHLCKPG
jgi:Cys-rich repeat protein